MTPFNIIVLGNQNRIEQIINQISYGPDKAVKHHYQPKGQNETSEVMITFGSIQVDDNNRIDFYGGSDPNLLKIFEHQSASNQKGMVLILDADLTSEYNMYFNLIKNNKTYFTNFKAIVGISGSSDKQSLQLKTDINNLLSNQKFIAPVFSLDTKIRNQVSLLVETLLCFTNPKIKEHRTSNS